MGATPKAVVIPVATGEAPIFYAASTQAQSVVNFERFAEAAPGSDIAVSIRSVSGPCPLEPDRGSGYQAIGECQAIFHGMFQQGTYDMTLLRAGSKLYRHAGWGRNWIELETGLDTSRRARYPEIFIRTGNGVVWSNGIDEPRMITPRGDGRVYPLGFSRKPCAPIAQGPAAVQTDGGLTYPNAQGYSLPGDIGSVGEVMDAGNGWLLKGEWVYYAQYEDFNGNLSPLSPPSNPCRVSQAIAQPWYKGRDADDYNCAEIDDLTRQFFVQVPATTESHIAAVRLYRTPDTVRNPPTPMLVEVIGGSSGVNYPDRHSDATLGPAAEEFIEVPNFTAGCAHQGRLVIAWGSSIAESLIGTYGTFPTDRVRDPDSSGADIVAVASHAGRLLAFTEDAVYDCTDVENSIPLAKGIGCVAPQSIATLPSGFLIWLGRDGFYGLQAGATSPVMVSPGYEKFVRRRLSKTRLCMATAAYNHASGEYLCAVTPAGRYRNTTILAFDGTSWRRQELGIGIAAMCSTNDARRYVLAAGTDGDDDNVFVLGHETVNYDPPARTIEYVSPWFRVDELASVPAYISRLYVGLVDSSNGQAVIEFMRNNVMSAVSSQAFLLHGRDGESGIEDDWAGEAIIGTSKFHTGRLMWRQIPADVQDAYTWCFRITCEYPTRIHLVGFAFELTTPTDGNPRSGRIPKKDD